MRGRSLILKWKHRLDEVTRHLAKRNLIWLGFRGADASVLAQIPQFSRVFSITAPLESAPAISETCLEVLQKKRADVHTYHPDDDSSQEACRMHRDLFAEFSKPTAVLTYRPDKFFASAYFPRSGNVEYFGLFYARQSAFENKPWVESELKKYGVRTIPWRYYSSRDLSEQAHSISQGPIVVRFDRLSIGGGGNMVIFRDRSEIAEATCTGPVSLISVSPYLEPSIPLNVNACVFQDGSVSLHGPSLQLIGIRSCTNLVLGYCGNDFSRIRNLDVAILNELEEMTIKVGKWLAGMGYLGVFGVDAIEYKGHVYFAEINPRFQNSSVIAALLDEELDRPDMYLNQMAVFFGLPAPPCVPLRELARQQRGLSQIICHNRYRQPVLRREIVNPGQKNSEFALLPAGDVAVVPEGLLFKAVVNGSVTEDGKSLLPAFEREIAGAAGLFAPILAG
jgi:hypothetical protein